MVRGNGFRGGRRFEGSGKVARILRERERERGSEGGRKWSIESEVPVGTDGPRGLSVFVDGRRAARSVRKPNERTGEAGR